MSSLEGVFFPFFWVMNVFYVKVWVNRFRYTLKKSPQQTLYMDSMGWFFMLGWHKPCPSEYRSRASHVEQKVKPSLFGVSVWGMNYSPTRWWLFHKPFSRIPMNQSGFHGSCHVKRCEKISCKVSCKFETEAASATQGADYTHTEVVFWEAWTLR